MGLAPLQPGAPGGLTRGAALGHALGALTGSGSLVWGPAGLRLASAEGSGGSATAGGSQAGAGAASEEEAPLRVAGRCLVFALLHTWNMPSPRTLQPLQAAARIANLAPRFCYYRCHALAPQPPAPPLLLWPLSLHTQQLGPLLASCWG
jgi:hypothetical protein